MSALLQVDASEVRRFDVQITQLAWTRLERAGTRLVLECADDDVERAMVLLARSGARAMPIEPEAAPMSGLVPALVHDLAPRDVPGIVDRVSVRRIDLGEATARLGSAERWHIAVERWQVSVRRRDPAPLRALLRGRERLFGWRRVLWARPALLRSRVLPGVRPVIFDREAIDRTEERLSFVLADELTRWAIG